MTDFQKWIFYQCLPGGKTRTLPSQNRVLSIVKGLFRFLHGEHGLLAQDPARNLQLAREPVALPRNILTTQEAQRVVEAPDLNTPVGCRDRALLELLYSTGVRRAELLALTVEALDLEHGLLRVDHGKGDKDRVVPLTRLACSSLGLYLNQARPQLLRGWATGRLFVSRKRGYALSGWGLQALLRRYAKTAQVTKHVTPHLWRHTCATHLLHNNANLRHVQTLLGHASLATTERYLWLTVSDLKAMHRHRHPRERAFRREKRLEVTAVADTLQA